MNIELLETQFLGKNIIEYDVIDSTQLEAWRLIENGNIKNGTIIISKLQTAGKGTHGRKWITSKPGNIAVSIIVECGCNINKLNGITIEIAKIILNIFKEIYKINLEMKIPNDIVINNRKVGGILTEVRSYGKIAQYMVVGIGINVVKNKFKNELENIATSLENEFENKINVNSIIIEFCNAFEKEILKRNIGTEVQI